MSWKNKTIPHLDKYSTITPPPVKYIIRLLNWLAHHHQVDKEEMRQTTNQKIQNIEMKFQHQLSTALNAHQQEMRALQVR